MQNKSASAVEPSAASPSSKTTAKVTQMLTRQAKADCHAPLDDDDMAPQSQPMTPPAEDPTATEKEVR